MELQGFCDEATAAGCTARRGNGTVLFEMTLKEQEKYRAPKSCYSIRFLMAVFFV